MNSYILCRYMYPLSKSYTKSFKGIGVSASILSKCRSQPKSRHFGKARDAERVRRSQPSSEHHRAPSKAIFKEWLLLGYQATFPCIISAFCKIQPHGPFCSRLWRATRSENLRTMLYAAMDVSIDRLNPCLLTRHQFDLKYCCQLLQLIYQFLNKTRKPFVC